MAQGPAKGALGARSDAAATTDAGTFSLIALVKRLLSRLTSGAWLIGVKGGDGTSLAAPANPVPTSDAVAQATLSSLNSKDFATQTTLASVLSVLQSQIEFSESLWTDDSGAYYLRRVTEDEATGTVTIVYTNPAGAVVTPGPGLRPLNGTDKEIESTYFDATAPGTGYTTGDILARAVIIDTSASPVMATALWLNITAGTTISAPTAGTYVEVTRNILAAQGTKGSAANAWPMRDDLATESHAADQNGAGAVLDFTITADSHFVMVDVDNTSSSDTATYRARATCDGTTPSATVGFVCRSGQTTYLPFPSVAGVIKVYAPSGTVVAAQGGKRA